MDLDLDGAVSADMVRRAVGVKETRSHERRQIQESAF